VKVKSYLRYTMAQWSPQNEGLVALTTVLVKIWVFLLVTPSHRG